MEREASRNPGVMLAILGLDIEQVGEIVAAVRDRVIPLPTITRPSRSSFPARQRPWLLPGSGRGARRQGHPLKVSGAWHSELVAGAVDDFLPTWED